MKIGPITDEQRKQVEDYEAECGKRRKKGLSTKKLTGTKLWDYDTLLEQARYFDLDPACDDGGDAESVWVPLDGRKLNQWEEDAEAAGYERPSYVRRFRWKQDSLKRIAGEVFDGKHG